MARTKEVKRTKVEGLRHKDKRANIPTEELRDFVAEDEKRARPMRYPRDPSLDPQAGRERRQGRGHGTPAGTNPRLPRYLERRHQLLARLFTRPPHRRLRITHRKRQRVCPNRRRERPPFAECVG